MSTTLTRWREGTLTPMNWADLFQVPAPTIRVEQFLDHGRYGVRAELPGFDPEKDVDVTVADGILRISAERREETREKSHSEFHYGRFVRTVVLPAGVAEGTATATYLNGLLEVSFAMSEPKPASAHIPIKVDRGHTAQSPNPATTPVSAANGNHSEDKQAKESKGAPA